MAEQPRPAGDGPTGEDGGADGTGGTVNGTADGDADGTCDVGPFPDVLAQRALTRQRARAW